jgi:hypothetical protein
MKSAPFFVLLNCAAILSSAPSRLYCQEQNASLEKQVRTQYQAASVAANGVVVRTGSIVVVQQDGITGIQVTPEVAAGSSWPNVYKKDGHVKTPALQALNYNPLKNWSRPLQVGERAYVISIQVKSTDIVFGLQTIPADANESPYRATLAFQFQKGELASADLKQVEGMIGDVLSIETSAPPQEPEGAQAATPGPAQDLLQDQDIIDLVKAGLDDATILAKIGISKCQFDTSTNALIKLKQGGVSAVVLKAMVDVGR